MQCQFDIHKKEATSSARCLTKFPSFALQLQRDLCKYQLGLQELSMQIRFVRSSDNLHCAISLSVRLGLWLKRTLQCLFSLQFLVPRMHESYTEIKKCSITVHKNKGHTQSIPGPHCSNYSAFHQRSSTSYTHGLLLGVTSQFTFKGRKI